MELTTLEQMEIQSYFNLDNRIERKRKAIKDVRRAFYNQTLTTHVESDESSLFSVGFRIEKEVVSLVDGMANMEGTLDLLEKKKRYLDDYLFSLNPMEKAYLTSKYTKSNLFGTVLQADIDIYDEILEINEAINFMYGYIQDEIEGLPKEFDINKTLAFLEA